MGGHNGTTAYRQQAMTDAERQCRRRQRLAAEQPWDAADEAKRIKLRLKSTGPDQEHLQDFAAALDGGDQTGARSNGLGRRR